MTAGEHCDLLLTGALVVDGSGAPGYPADVAVADGRIAAVGDLSAWRADHCLDATGRILAPGFIDAHSHDERVVLDEPDHACKASQGVTTVVAGNCGISLAPVVPLDRMPPPFELLGDESDYRYPTVAAYREAFAEAAPSVNLALLVGHTSLRIGAMGDDLDRPATADEVAGMAAALDRALDEGALGLSSGVDYPPAAAATTDELAALAEVAGLHPGAVYATHIRDESDGVLEAVHEAVETADRGRVPLVLSHHKCAGTANHGRSVGTLAAVDAARARQPVALDVYPYTASSTSLLPQYVEDSESVLVSWSDPHPDCAGRRLDDIAADWGCSLAEAIERLVPAGGIYFQIDEDDLRRILAHGAAMVGSDGLPGRGRPHPRLWGTFPRVLARYVRDEGLLTLEQAVHKMTGLPAATFGLADRGLVREGRAADLVLFDPDEVADRATFEDPEQSAVGIELVVVNGVVTRRGEGATGDRSGRFLERRSA